MKIIASEVSKEGGRVRNCGRLTLEAVDGEERAMLGEIVDAIARELLAVVTLQGSSELVIDVILGESEVPR